MKGKRYTREDKVRILREADSGKAILEVCREHNISEVSFHRWKRQFGQLEVNEARRLKDLERENGELKKMLAEALLKNRVLEAGCEKNSKPGASPRLGPESRGGGDLLRAGGVSDSAIGAVNLLVLWSSCLLNAGAPTETTAGVVRRASPLWVSADRGAVASGRLASGQTTDSAVTTRRRSPRTAHQAQGGAAWRLDGLARPSHASWACLDLGLHRGCHGARWGLADADNPGRIHP